MNYDSEIDEVAESNDERRRRADMLERVMTERPMMVDASDLDAVRATLSARYDAINRLIDEQMARDTLADPMNAVPLGWIEAERLLGFDNDTAVSSAEMEMADDDTAADIMRYAAYDMAVALSKLDDDDGSG